jgi:hypothetical protein
MLVLAPSAFAQQLPGDVTKSHDLSFDVDLANARFTGTERSGSICRNRRGRTLNAAEITFRQVTIESGGGTDSDGHNRREPTNGDVPCPANDRERSGTDPRCVPASSTTSCAGSI